MAPMSYLGQLLLLGICYGQTRAFECNSPNTNITLSAGLFPSPGEDSSYSEGTVCSWKIPAKAGMYVQVTVDTPPTDTYDILNFFDDRNLLLRYTSGMGQNPIVTPIDLYIHFEAFHSGNLRFSWNYLTIPYTNGNPTRISIRSGSRGALAEMAKVYSSSLIISCNSSIAIQAAANPFGYGRYLMMYGFIYDGEGTSGQYLGSLYWLQDQPVYIWSKGGGYTTTTITVVSGNNLDYGIALVKPYQDVKDYTVSLQYGSDKVHGTDFSKDSSLHDVAITFYNADSSDMYLMSISFASVGGLLAWQAGDLRPTGPLITSYTRNNNLTSLPQAIPGILKTLVVSGGICNFKLAFSTPSAFGNVPSPAFGIFSSANFPFSDLPQSHEVRYTLQQRSSVTVKLVAGANNGSGLLFSVDNSPLQELRQVNNQLPPSYTMTGRSVHFLTQNQSGSGALATFTFTPTSSSPSGIRIGFVLPLVFSTVFV